MFKPCAYKHLCVSTQVASQVTCSNNTIVEDVNTMEWGRGRDSLQGKFLPLDFVVFVSTCRHAANNQKENYTLKRDLSELKKSSFFFFLFSRGKPYFLF